MSLSPLETRTVPARFAAQMARDPEATFMVGQGMSWTYREAEAEVADLASAIAAWGIGKASRVAVLHDRKPRYVIILLALARLGAVAVALNTDTREQLLEYYLADSGAELLLVDSEHADPPVAGLIGDLELNIVRLANGDGWIDLLRDAGGGSGVEVGEEPRFLDPFVVVYTSGSTGRPKGVEITHAQAVTCGEIFVEHLDLGPDDRLYTCLPFFHINATNYTLCGALACGGSIAVGPKFSARRFWADVAELGSTQVNAMGSMLKILESRDTDPVEREHSVRSIFAAPLPSNVKVLADRWGVEFATTYAQTEWLPSSMTRPGEGYGLDGATGPILPYSEVLVVDEDDRTLPPGSVGEIALRAHDPFVAFSGYIGKPEVSLESFRNLRFHTGDRGEIDDRGWLYFRGRAKDVIRRRGENIAAPMVEGLMVGHEHVLEAAAVPVPSSLMEDDIFVYLTLGHGGEPSVEDLLDYARDVMPRYMVPLYIELVDELPRTATNKIAKSDLTDRATQAVKDGKVAPLWR
jgi:crotonobetaine/carnitine-CoA ligase